MIREIEAVPRQAAADSMEISVNTLDNTLSTARSKIETAEETIETIEELRHEEIPSSCDECGSTLGGRWAETEDGDVLCIGCSAAEEGEV